MEREIHIRKCTYCEQHYDTAIMVYDHFIPRSKGGSNSHNNKYLCCCYCNSSKSDFVFKNLDTAKSFLKSRAVYWFDRSIEGQEK